MHTLIISGGTIDTDFALDLLKKEKYDHIIGVDGALKFCKSRILSLPVLWEILIPWIRRF